MRSVRAVRCKSRKLRCDVDPLDRLGRRALPGLPEMDQPVGLHVWQRPQQNPVDHAENRRRRANAKRQRQHGHRGKRAVTAQRAQRHFDVLNQAVHVAPARQRACPCCGELRAPVACRRRTTRHRETGEFRENDCLPDLLTSLCPTTGSPTVGRRSPCADNLCPLPSLPRTARHSRMEPAIAVRARPPRRQTAPRLCQPLCCDHAAVGRRPRAARRNGSDDGAPAER